MYSKSTIALAGSLALANGAVHTVMVGKGGLNYMPNSLTAAVGDSVEFQFESQGHSVAQGSFDKPCTPSGANAFYSGFVKPGGEPFTITIENTDPIWFYCTQVSHCQSGMVGVINPPSGKTVDDFSSAAGNTDGTTAPNSVGGGTFGMPSSMAPAMSSTMMMSSSMAPMSSMSSMMESSSMMPSGTMSSMMSQMTSSMMESGSMMSSTAEMSATGMSSSPSASTTSPPTNGAGRLVSGAGAVLAAAAAFAL